MTKFEIREDGNKFTTIEALTADEALDKAEREIPRRSSEYNGYVGPVTWGAFTDESNEALALRTVLVK